MGILGAIAKALAKGAGGKMVARDVAASKAYLHKELLEYKGLTVGQYHTHNLNNLIGSDSGVSKDWIADLISKSSTPSELGKIMQYLGNTAKSYNLNATDKASLLKAATAKIKAIQQSDAMDRMIEFMKQHGEDLL